MSREVWETLMAQDMDSLFRRQDDMAINMRIADVMICARITDSMYASGQWFEAMIRALRLGFWRYNRPPDLDYMLFARSVAPRDVRTCAQLTLAKLRGATGLGEASLYSTGTLNKMYCNILYFGLVDGMSWLAIDSPEDVDTTLNNIFDMRERGPMTQVQVNKSFPGSYVYKDGHIAMLHGNTQLRLLMRVVADVRPELLSERHRRALRRLLPCTEKFAFSDIGICGMWCGWGTCRARMRRGGLCAKHRKIFRKIARGAGLCADVAGVVREMTW